MDRKGSQNFIELFTKVLILLFCITECFSVKIRYASNTDCDRFSLDAVYNEKYKLITENIFKDTVEFVNRVSDLTADSLSSTMATMPDRDASSNEERKIYTQFKGIKTTYSSKIRKAKRNITAMWDDLVTNHFELLYDSGKITLKEYLSKVLNVTEAYKEAKATLDLSLGAFVNFIKTIVRDGLQGISFAADDSLKKEAANKANSTEEEKEEEKSDEKLEKEEAPEDKLTKKKLEIIDMVVSGFLRQVSIEVVKRDMDLFRKIEIKPEDRDSVLDDILFDMLLIKNRMQAIIQDDIPKEKGSIDLARRSVYAYWIEQASQMYKEKLESKKSSGPGGKNYYKTLWKDEKIVVDTLLSLFEVFD